MLNDIIDLILLRAQPLEHYRYPVWQPLLLLLAISSVNGVVDQNFTVGIGEKIVFFTVLNLVITFCLAAFLKWWLTLKNRWQDQQGNLWVLVVVSSALDFVQPLALWFDQEIMILLVFILSIYGLVILINAITVATGVTRRYVAGGVLLALPLIYLINLFSLSVAAGLGWVVLPVAPS